MPSAVKQKPATRLGHGVVVGALAAMKNAATASSMPQTTHSQAKGRIRARSSKCAQVSQGLASGLAGVATMRYVHMLPSRGVPVVKATKQFR